ncbi:MAG: orotidine-5'-phosphate decarboxylase [Alphaproteobacteria bacterium]|nr:orotidine-5'-phosphate decarboxylase [Alphaproteobacteria bacterium]
MLSDKSIDLHDRLIFALDVPTPEEARALVEELGDSVSFYKVGLELFMAGGYIELIDWLVRDKGKKVFADLKFFDVPQTVASAVRNLARTGAHFATVHGNDAIMEAAAREKGAMKILAVTALTSLDRGDLDDLGFQVDVADLVLSRARRSLALGCDGVISSGLEAPVIRGEVGQKILIITPGVRPVQNDDDQKRTVDVAQAFENGADYIVVGRPIRDHHGFETRKEAAESIQKTIASVFAA